MRQYERINPAIQEQRTAKDVIKSLPTPEREAFFSMTEDELKYLKEECEIDNYIDYLRRGKQNQAVGSEFPVLVVKGTDLQLMRFKVVFLASLIDYQGVEQYYPSQFSLGEEVLEEMRNFTGVAIVKIVKGASTTEGLDNFRSELILSTVAARRDFFNPTLILTEETISGKLNTSNELTKVIYLDADRLSASYDGSKVYSDVIVSRSKPVQAQQPKREYTSQEYKPTQSKTTTYSYSKGKKQKKLSVNEMIKMRQEQEDID